MPYAIVAVIVLIIDQTVKYWTSLHIELNGNPSTLIPGFIEITNIHNDGAAFGLLGKFRWFFIVLTLLFVIIVVILLKRNIIKGKLGRWSLVLVTAGGLGNCIDRIFNGYVVDMFQFQLKILKNFAVFNVADMFITVFGIIFCIYLIFHKDKKEEPAFAPEGAPTGHLPDDKVRPAKKTDYITQVKKPVVDGRANIEDEIAAKRSANQPVSKIDSTISDWNMPDFEDKSSKDSQSSESSDSQNIPAQDEQEQAAPDGSVVKEVPEKPAQQTKKKNSEFSLDDIIAEFKD